jgi:hypothetical protein
VLRPAGFLGLDFLPLLLQQLGGGRLGQADTPAQTKQTSRFLLHPCKALSACRKPLCRQKFTGMETGRWDFKSAASTDSAMPPLGTARARGESVRLRSAKQLGRPGRATAAVP